MRTVALLTTLVVAWVPAPAMGQVPADSLTHAQRAAVINSFLETRIIMFGRKVQIDRCSLAKVLDGQVPDSVVQKEFRDLLVGTPPDRCDQGGRHAGDRAVDLLSIEDVAITTATAARVPGTVAWPSAPVVVVRVFVVQPLAQMSWTEKWVVGVPTRGGAGFIQLQITGSAVS